MLVHPGWLEEFLQCLWRMSCRPCGPSRTGKYVLEPELGPRPSPNFPDVPLIVMSIRWGAEAWVMGIGWGAEACGEGWGVRHEALS